MNILHIIFSLENGGKENMLIDIANAQKDLGHNVAIVVVNRNLDQAIINRISAKVKLYVLKRKRTGLNPFPWFRLFYFIHWYFKPDVIHSHDLMLGGILKILTKKKRVFTLHGPGRDTSGMKDYDLLVAISNSVKEDVESRSKLKCEVVLNGIKTDAVRQRIDWNIESDFRIVLVKRLNHELKGQDILIRAANKLVHKNNKQNFKFFFIGEGPSREYLEKMVEKKHLKEHVFIEGNWPRDKVYQKLADFHLFVHPSRIEGFGLSIVEAISAKIPVISSDVGGPAEILDESTGFLFESENSDELVNQIVKVEEMYKNALIPEFVEKAYKNITCNYDIRTTASQYCKLYETT